MKKDIGALGLENAKSRQKKLYIKKKILQGLSITFGIAILVLLVWIIFFQKQSYIKTYENQYVSFKYDTTWKISKQDIGSISLTHQTNSIVDIKVSNLTSKYLNSKMEDIVEEVRYDIEKQNVGYKVLKEEKKIVSDNMYEGYKILYENGESQSLIIILREDNHLCVINYISNNEYFDILLDSFHLILSNLKIK